MALKCLAFCLTIWAVSGAQDLVVSQPSSAQGTEGGSVMLRCSYNSTSTPKVGSYQWVKDPGLAVKNSTKEFTGRVNCTSDQHFLLDRRADLEIRDLRHYDSGIYSCVVTIHGLPEASGNGTKLQVVKATAAPKDSKNVVSLPMGLGTGLGSVLVISAAVPLIFLCCRRRQGRRAKESRAEGPCQDPVAKAEVAEAADLNYVELIVIKKGKKTKTQRETVTYASVERSCLHDGVALLFDTPDDNPECPVSLGRLVIPGTSTPRSHSIRIFIALEEDQSFPDSEV